MLEHGEDSQLVDRTEAVLLASQRAETRVRATFQQQRGIDHVLEYLGAGQRAVLGHMPHQHEHRAGLLGESCQGSGGLSHLSHSPGRRRDILQVRRLDGVDDQDLGTLTLGDAENRLDAGLGQHLQAWVGSWRRWARIATCDSDSSPVT